MSTLGATTSLDRQILPFILRAGLLLIQLSSRSSANVTVVLLYNTCELILATVAYVVVDHVFAAWQIIGQSTWTSPEDKTITGWSAVITATGLFTAMISGRMHRVGYITVIVIMAAFIDPVMMFWIQPNKSVMHKYDARAVLRSYKNMGGCAIIHICAGFVALLAVIFVGRKSLSRRDILNYNPVPKSTITCFLGYCLLIVGIVAMCMLPNLPHQTIQATNEYVVKILKNNVMATVGGVVVVIFMRFAVEKLTLKFCTVLRCMKGAIAGIVIISSGVDVYTSLTAFLLGMVGGAFYYFVARKLFRSPWEEADYSNMIPIHLLCGLVSTLMLPIFGDVESFAIGGSAAWGVVKQVSWQIVYKTSLLVSLFIIFLPVFLLLHCFGLNQKKSENGVEYRQVKMAPEGSLRRQVSKCGGKLQHIKVLLRDEFQDERQSLKALREKQKAYLRYFNPRLANQTRA